MSWLIKESINVYSNSLGNSTHKDELNQGQGNTKIHYSKNTRIYFLTN